jgi:carboxylate-amine ligase
MADFKFGIEEEFFLVDADTKSAARAMPAEFLAAAQRATGGQVSGELLQSQVEIVTLPHSDMAGARAELRFLRQAVAKIAGEHGLAILAAGTHPTAAWRDMQQTESERYDAVMHDLQMIGQRNMLCGMHVHVELPEADERVDVMTRMLPYLPLFVALATSSPFWDSRRTGLKGYRLAAYDELPRTGVPELFRTKEEFEAYVAALVRGGAMEDSSYVWWAIRPSLDYPTLELRAPVAARWSRIRSPSRRSTACWCAISRAIRNATRISTRWRAPSWSRTNGGRSVMA